MGILKPMLQGKVCLHVTGIFRGETNQKTFQGRGMVILW